MELNSNVKLFIVQFGRPDRGDGWYILGGSDQTFYVLASDYGSACQKAVIAYQEWKDNRPILDSDGSLAISTIGMEQDDMIGIKNVRLACDKIIY